MTACPDCPDMGAAARQPARARCCRDDYLDAREEGHFESGWPGGAEGRAMVDKHQASPAGKPNRRQRRVREAKKRKAK